MATPNPTSLFIEEYPDGVGFYINGDLQFDSRDEAIYHQYLVGPAIALAVERFPQEPLHVLICGGGDGLAARDVLHFEQVRQIVLVDYDAAVVNLARSRFLPYNQGSLNPAENVTVHIAEAFEFARELPDSCFHVVICDFTCPDSPAAEAVYSQEWFEQIHRLLLPQGVMATNGLSPDREPQAFWCIYQTLLATGFDVKPMQLEIPSFTRHGYGRWGFFLASVPIMARSRLETLPFPSQFHHLAANWHRCFVFSNHIACWRNQIYLNTLAHPQLLFYRFNPRYVDAQTDIGNIDFLDHRDTLIVVESDRDPFSLAFLVNQWLRQSPPPVSHPSQLCPVLHAGHPPPMAESWLEHSPQMLAQIDPQQLANALEQYPLPPKLQKILIDLPRSHQKINPRSPIAIVLSAIMMAANLSIPDIASAKGYWVERNDVYPGNRVPSSYTMESLLIHIGFGIFIITAILLKPSHLLMIITIALMSIVTFVEIFGRSGKS